MKIRLAEKKDLKQIIKLCKLHADYEKVTYNSTNKESLLANHLLNNSIKCLVAEENSQIKGYATFMKQFSTWDTEFYIYLDCLFFKEEARGNGLGKKMMNEIKNYAKSESCDIIQWQTPNFNLKAIKFYKTLGANHKTKERFFWNI